MIEALIVLALTGCAAGREELTCRFPAPPELSRRQVRLDVACSATIYLNGATIAGGTPLRVVTDFLAGGGSNTLRMGANCAPARLLVTPRVYIARMAPDGGGLSVTVENALDNTVSVGLSCRGPNGTDSASATIPANGQSELAISVSPKGKVICTLEKLHDALEGPYQFHMETIYQ